ncbi:MAG: hypothetical protein SV966_17945 [Actinomycetota bacterium]|nr:hypothetical protein [Actinomycetota bacterium]
MNRVEQVPAIHELLYRYAELVDGRGLRPGRAGDFGRQAPTQP